jgi:hypothetical protein
VLPQRAFRADYGDATGRDADQRRRPVRQVSDAGIEIAPAIALAAGVPARRTWGPSAAG